MGTPRLSNNFYKEINKKVLNSRAMKQEATKIAQASFNQAKSSLINDFVNHPVSQEISNGPYGPKSKYLDGISDGNLFSFIGFDAGDNPVEKVKEFLDEAIVMNKNPQLSSTKSSYKFIIRYPTVKDNQISKAAPMPRGTSLNWLYAIENGISGINSYLFDRKRSFSTSKSGPAIQTKVGGKAGGEVQEIRSGGSFKPIIYLTEIVNRFIKRLGGKI